MNIAGIARLVRLPNLVFMVAFQCLLRYGLVLPMLAEAGVEPRLSAFQFAMLVVATVGIAAGGNAINDYFDVEADRVNKPARVVVGTTVDRRAALLTHVTTTLAGLFAGVYLSYILRRPAFLLLFVSLPVLLWFYSTHFKKQILVGNLLVALLVALTGYMVVSVEFAALDRVHAATGEPPLSWIWYIVCAYSIFAFISNLGREMIKDMEDKEGDAQAGCHTLVIELGDTYAKTVITLVEAVLIAGCTMALAAVPDCIDATIPTVYFVALIVTPTIALCAMLWRGRTPHDYHRAATLSKVIMAAGMLSILLINK
ncbi:MAG: geranylgeranylglycerol-phosphate geranylgeranyltransferase [Marinilabiliaceae bacterium]